MASHCPFCMQEFATLSEVVAHVENQACNVWHQHTSEDRFNLETSLLQIEIKLCAGHHTDQDSSSTI